MPVEPELIIDLACPHCPWAEVCGPQQIVAWLHGAGMLKRNPHPSRDELRELLLAVAPRLACPQCSRLGLHAQEGCEQTADWQTAGPPTATRCQMCGQPIAAERLEIFPGTRCCAPCQQAAERGGQQAAAPRDPDYCPKCGTPRELRQRKGAGITRYVMTCPACSRR